MKKLIYDIGLHTGRDTEFYLKKGFKVIAIEAIPDFIAKAREKFKKEITNGQLIIIDKAITDKPVAEVDFFINTEKDDWGTSLPDWNRGMNSNFQRIKVPAIQLETILEEHGEPYYMKIDIEGSDIICLKALQKTNFRPENISVELMTPNNFKEKKVDCLGILSHLHVLGYSEFKVVDQSKNHLVKCPFPSKEGEYIDFAFGGDTSGLFGKELDLPTYTLDEISKLYLEYFFENKEEISEKSWFRNKLINKAGLTPKKRDDVFKRDGWFDIHAYSSK
jgi:FkbM family methyltransferase